MSGTLALKHRPRRFAHVVGQRQTTAVLGAMVTQDDLPPAIILDGTRGSGKTTTARILAAALNCLDRTGPEPCGTCGSCLSVWASNSTSVLEMDAASHNGIEDVRRIQEIVRYRHGGEWRVVVLDEVHSMSKEAFNALLKILEEPPPGVVFVMLTTEPHRILETIRSRSMSFTFRRITVADITARLREIAAEEGIAAEERMLEEIARRARGGLRDAIMLLDQANRLGIADAATFEATWGSGSAASDVVVAAIDGDRLAAVLAASQAAARTGDAGQLMAEVTEVMADLMVAKLGGRLDASPAEAERRAGAAARAEPGAIERGLRVLWGARDRLRNDDDPVTAAQVITGLLCEAVRPTTITRSGSTVPTTPAPALDVAEMTRRAAARTSTGG